MMQYASAAGPWIIVSIIIIVIITIIFIII
jgi:hypothetical protein